jgi:hypothetical protein
MTTISLNPRVLENFAMTATSPQLAALRKPLSLAISAALGAIFATTGEAKNTKNSVKAMLKVQESGIKGG